MKNRLLFLSWVLICTPSLFFSKMQAATTGPPGTIVESESSYAGPMTFAQIVTILLHKDVSAWNFSDIDMFFSSFRHQQILMKGTGAHWANAILDGKAGELNEETNLTCNAMFSVGCNICKISDKPWLSIPWKESQFECQRDGVSFDERRQCDRCNLFKLALCIIAHEGRIGAPRERVAAARKLTITEKLEWDILLKVRGEWSDVVRPENKICVLGMLFRLLYRTDYDPRLGMAEGGKRDEVEYWLPLLRDYNIIPSPRPYVQSVMPDYLLALGPVDRVARVMARYGIAEDRRTEVLCRLRDARHDFSRVKYVEEHPIFSKEERSYIDDTRASGAILRQILNRDSGMGPHIWEALKRCQGMYPSILPAGSISDRIEYSKEVLRAALEDMIEKETSYTEKTGEVGHTARTLFTLHHQGYWVGDCFAGSFATAYRFAPDGVGTEEIKFSGEGCVCGMGYACGAVSIFDLTRRPTTFRFLPTERAPRHSRQQDDLVRCGDLVLCKDVPSNSTYLDAGMSPDALLDLLRKSLRDEERAQRALQKAIAGSGKLVPRRRYAPSGSSSCASRRSLSGPEGGSSGVGTRKSAVSGGSLLPCVTPVSRTAGTGSLSRRPSSSSSRRPPSDSPRVTTLPAAGPKGRLVSTSESTHVTSLVVDTPKQRAVRSPVDPEALTGEERLREARRCRDEWIAAGRPPGTGREWWGLCFPSSERPQRKPMSPYVPRPITWEREADRKKRIAKEEGEAAFERARAEMRDPSLQRKAPSPPGSRTYPKGPITYTARNRPYGVPGFKEQVAVARRIANDFEKRQAAAKAARETGGKA